MPMYFPPPDPDTERLPGRGGGPVGPALPRHLGPVPPHPRPGLPVPRLRLLRLPPGHAVPRHLLGPDRRPHGRHPRPLPQVPHAAVEAGPARGAQHEHAESAEHKVGWDGRVYNILASTQGPVLG